MNKSIVWVLVVLIVVAGGVWYWSANRSEDGVPQPPATQPVVVAPASYTTYKDDTLGYSITFPVALSSTTNDAFYRVESGYAYTGMGAEAAIPGVKFTIPRVMTAGTNLSPDSYLSVEHLALGQACDAIAFLGGPDVTSQTVREGSRTYSLATSSEAAAGNRYDEYVYTVLDSSPCIAVRYFVHYSAIENYPEGTVKEFNKNALISTFDQIRKTLVLTK